MRQADDTTSEEAAPTAVAAESASPAPAATEAEPAVTSKPEVKPAAPAAEKAVTAESNRIHPSTIGRVANDPRVAPGQPVQGPVLQQGVARMTAPSPATGTRTVPEGHPSLVGRVSNDPRAANLASPANDADQVRELAEDAG